MARLGGHRLARALVAFYVFLLALAAAGFWMTGLNYRVSPLHLAILTVVLAVWIIHVAEPGRKPADWATADALMAFLLLLTFTHVASPLQYVAVALKEPLVDPQLADIDHMLGVYVPSIVEWTRARPLIADVLVVSYDSLLPQFFLPVLVIGLWYRDQWTLWEYVFHFHFCAAVTVACLAIWPAICPPTYYGFTPLIDMTRLTSQIQGLHDGSFRGIDADQLEGLVSVPSFHAAGALMVTWAFRKHSLWLGLLVPLNLLMLASTVMTGAHYLVDVLATAVLFAVSLAVYARSGLSRWHQQ